MTTKQREVLDAIHLAWKLYPSLTLPQLLTKAFNEPLVQDHGIPLDWEFMTNEEMTAVLLSMTKKDKPKCKRHSWYLTGGSDSEFMCERCGAFKQNPRSKE